LDAWIVASAAGIDVNLKYLAIILQKSITDFLELSIILKKLPEL
jgi:hypothetical protein